MEAKVKELYEIKADEYAKLYACLKDAFAKYPKLATAFTDWDDRQAAIEMVISYYLAYDLKYGKAYSLDLNINEALVVVHSKQMDYSPERCVAANCVNDNFKAAASKLSEEQIGFWWDFFDEFDRQEASLDIPSPHIYVDYLGVREEHQSEGRGTKLIQALCRYADEIKLPIMLFTNGEADIRFYLKNGFKVIGITKSEEHSFENTYFLYEPQQIKSDRTEPQQTEPGQSEPEETEPRKNND